MQGLLLNTRSVVHTKLEFQHWDLAPVLQYRQQQQQQQQQLSNSSRLCGVWGDPDVHDLTSYAYTTHSVSI